MANSCFEYVKSFEVVDKLDPAHWVIINLHCSTLNELFTNPAENILKRQELQVLLCNMGKKIMDSVRDIIFTYCYDQNIHFLLKKNSTFYKRRGFKLLSSISSLVTSFLSMSIMENYSDKSIKNISLFDGTIYMMPSTRALQDYFQIQQKKCHINNLRKTYVQKLVISGSSFLSATSSSESQSESDLNEALFAQFEINYNNEPNFMKKGVCLIQKGSQIIEEISVDMNDKFWDTLEFGSLERKANESYINLLKRSMRILPHTWLVVRVDGKCFHQFTDNHEFTKPNDQRGLILLNKVAEVVMESNRAIILAYGISDEYSFIIRRYNHRQNDAYSLIAKIVSLFTGAYVRLWATVFDIPLRTAPSFDCRLVVYPTVSNLRDYMSWRQADCHINNLYNTCFWNLVAKGMSRNKAQLRLSGTVSSDKLEILRQDLGIDYSEEPAMYRKGTVLYLDKSGEHVISDHCDIIQDDFWLRKPWLLGEEKKANNISLQDFEGL